MYGLRDLINQQAVPSLGIIQSMCFLKSVCHL